MSIEIALENTAKAKGGDAMRKWQASQSDYQIEPSPQRGPGASGTRIIPPPPSAGRGPGGK